MGLMVSYTLSETDRNHLLIDATISTDVHPYIAPKLYGNPIKDLHWH